jgi:pimeloyl-ACP methyl ester carboxylesterase
MRTGRVAVAALAVLLSGCGMYKGFLYPAPDPVPPLSRALFEPIEACAHDGAIAHGYFIPPPDARAPVVVVFHGNGETMENRAALALELAGRGLGVALGEYRGYGLSQGGAPDERGLYMDAAAVLEALYARGVGPERVVLMGISLGSGVAAQMASCGAGSRLVLVSPFTSMTEEAHYVVSWLPTGWLVPDRYDTLGKAPAIRVPTLVVHGDADTMVPFSMGQRVAAAIPGARLFTVHGGHHNDLLHRWRREIVPVIADFALAGRRGQRDAACAGGGPPPTSNGIQNARSVALAPSRE